MSDWGASDVYGGNNESAKHFEAIEVLAFGRLVQDLFDMHSMQQFQIQRSHLISSEDPDNPMKGLCMIS